MKKTFFLTLFLFYQLSSIAQTPLDVLRHRYCTHPLCLVYKKEYKTKERNIKFVPDMEKAVHPEFSKRIFSIPFEKRMNLYPFSEYDTIYIATPNLHQVAVIGDSAVNFLNFEHVHIKKIASRDDIAIISDIFFNYYYFYGYMGIFGISPVRKKGFYLSSEYPQLTFLFYKNGRIEKFIGFGKSRWNWNSNFTYEEYVTLGLSAGDREREILILKLFEEYIDEPVEIRTLMYKSKESKGRIETTKR